MKYLVAILLIVSILFAWPNKAAAHVLKTDNGTSAVLHIAPDDNPLAGTPTTLQFSFGSDSPKFSLQSCDCIVTVTEQGKTISQVPIQAPNDPANGQAVVKFPTTGVYQVDVIGKAKDASFPNFNLDYLIRVASVANGASGAKLGVNIFLIGGAAFLVLGVVAADQIKKGGRYSNHSK